MKVLRRLALLTTVAVFLLIMVGAFVRASGSGLGCPDWPHCYGRWIPPTSIEQVPLAQRADFNVWKTWTEYVNRLLGVSIGFLCIATMIAAFMPDVRRHRPIVASVVTATLLTGFQGWQGGQVVKKQLDPRFVTVHLFLAVVIAMLFIHAATESRRVSDGQGAFPGRKASPKERRLIWTSLVLSVFQLILGALVRGSIEIVAKKTPDLPRSEWFGAIGLIGTLHEGLAIALAFFLIAFALWTLTRADRNRWDRGFALGLLSIILLQSAAGLILAREALPPAAQVLHVIGGSLITGLLYAHLRVATLRAGPGAG